MSKPNENGNGEIKTRYDFAIRFAERIGFPAVVVGLLLYGIWVVGSLLVSGHVEFVKTMGDSTKLLAESAQKQAESVDELRTILGAQAESLNRSVANQERMMIEHEIIMDNLNPEHNTPREKN